MPDLVNSCGGRITFVNRFERHPLPTTRGSGLHRLLVVGILVFLGFFGISSRGLAVDIAVALDLSQPGVLSMNVVRRSLFYSTPANPVNLGAVGIGSFATNGSVTLPFDVEHEGDYHLVVTYGLSKANRRIQARIDGSMPDDSWTECLLWPSTQELPWGSISLYLDYWLTDCSSRHLTCWTVGNLPAHLAQGRHALRLDFPGGDVVITEIRLTTARPPANSTTPWVLDNDIPFPALDFTSQTVEHAGTSSRITFHGRWQNLAPHPVAFGVSSFVMPRKGRDSSTYRVVDIDPEDTLSLQVAESRAFALTVESSEPVSATDSEIIRLNLTSLDVPKLVKPYLMSAATGYLDLPADPPFYHSRGGQYWLAIRDGIPATSVIPTRESLDFSKGYPQRSVHEAFVHALSNASPAVTSVEFNCSWVNYTAWAQAGAPRTWSTESRCFPSWEAFEWSGTSWRHPLARILAGQGEDSNSLAQLKDLLLTLSNEMPYYPIEGRWDQARPQILPTFQYEYSGVVALASYVKLLQARAVTQEEHFRFLHNVVLPSYLILRDDWRIHGTLAETVVADELPSKNYLIRLSADVPAKTVPGELVGEWLQIGSGAEAEYVRVIRRHENGVEITPMPPGVLRRNHAAGEPWFSFHMREWIELEGTDLWSFLAVAVASRDAAVVEQVGEILERIYSTQNLFREDGSFGNEPGSYGWGAFEYLIFFQQIQHFLGSAVRFPPELRDRMLRALMMWNEFPFSDGLHPMLNRGGAANQSPRLLDYPSGVAVPRSLRLLKDIFPEQTNLIHRYTTVFRQETDRQPGSFVDNQSFKVDGWGYSMLRGPGSWDTRMETLLASKKLNANPGDHVSADALGICLFAHGALMTPRYGYHWIGYPALLLNRVSLDHAETRAAEPDTWGDFLHFDGYSRLPSVVAYTDMALPHQTKPGPARQERWNVQMPEYLFDAYFVNALDDQEHVIEWGFRNLGSAEFIAPPSNVSKVQNEDGTPWDPFGYYRANTGHDGRGFVTDRSWQIEWTLNEGNITFDSTYPYPPRGRTIRLTMASEPNTQVVAAWLVGLGRNDSVQLRQDFVVAERKARHTVFVNTIEPVIEEPFVRAVEVMAQDNEGSQAVRVSTVRGVDWFLVGNTHFTGPPQVRTVGPFTTDAKLAAVRIGEDSIRDVMFAGGSSLQFADGSHHRQYSNTAADPFHISEPPRIRPPAEASANEHVEWSTTIQAAGTVRRKLQFALGPEAPPGAAIESTTGRLSWTPGENDGPGTTSIPVNVTEDGSPPLSTSLLVRVTANEVNAAPIVDSIENRSVDEGATLHLTVTAHDPNDVPSNTVTLSAVGLPEGAVFDASSATLTWTPSEIQGDGTHVVTFLGTDDGIPSLTASQSVSITVREVNAAPTLDPIPTATVADGQLLEFQVHGADPADAPPNALSYAAEDLPPGAQFDPSHQRFSWVPAANEVGEYRVRFLVRDDGTPPLSSSQTVFLRIESSAPPRLELVERIGGQFRFHWSTRPGARYRVQAATTLAPADWQNLRDVIATGDSAEHTESFEDASRRYFRVVREP